MERSLRLRIFPASSSCNKYFSYIIISIPPPSAGGTNSNESVPKGNGYRRYAVRKPEWSGEASRGGSGKGCDSLYRPNRQSYGFPYGEKSPGILYRMT
mgnify:CR=1 FL=1